MDQIKIGLDFGTHQTKICVQRTPDEGHGEPNYEFFQFSDLQGNNTYFLPSVIQINDDDTLSYGYVDASRKKAEPDTPQKESLVLEDTFDVPYMANGLYSEYSSDKNTREDIQVLEKMLQIRLRNIKARNKKRQEEAELHEELQQVAYRSGNRHDKPWKIDFPEDAGICGEDIRALVEDGREVVPEGDAGHVKQGLGQAVGRDSRQAAEHEHVHDRGQHRLDEKPERTQNGLFVDRYDVPPDVHADKVTVEPNSFEVNVQQAFLGLYDSCPFRHGKIFI